ncbi:DUF1566 domain-containing protein [Limisalsivibrio acetivorans]|uniref:Lcl C-terminal domain-containing protein n=1 Tax=Limisalsivibrio acetivorans TaxID=1304888 RepID=UPI0003B388C0|nr:DUF1566 domain-containing protein [Limisalsivibrio acetivorans]
MKLRTVLIVLLIGVFILACGGGGGGGSSEGGGFVDDDNETVIDDDNDTVIDDNDTVQLTYPVVDTGQTGCYDSSSGNSEPCSGKGYDADYTGNQPSYTVTGGIVTDKVTGLMWMQSTDLDDDGDLADVDDKLSYDDAVTYCAELELGGYSDWRLPDIKTLYSLILFTGTDPTSYTGTDTEGLDLFIDGSFSRTFGDQDNGERLIDGQYISSTKYVYTTMNGDETVFGVNFVDGRIKGYPVAIGGGDKLFYLSCVRGNGDYGKNSYTDNGDGTVTDSATGLMWQRGDSASSSFEDAVSTCESASTAGYSDWRLPNVKELQTLVDYSRSPDTTGSAAIDPVFSSTSFLNEEGATDWGYYWSSTTHASYGGNGRSGSYVSFGRALGYMNGNIMDVHGAGAQRSNSKQTENGEGAETALDYEGDTFYYKGPQGDIQRIDNMVRCVRDAG